MNVLLLGGCGYTGRALWDGLKEDHKVSSVDLEWFGGHEGNFVRPYQSLSKEELHEFDAAVLLAGHSSVPLVQNYPRQSFNNNIIGFEDLLSKIDQQKLIFASSSSIYSGNRHATEGTLLGPPINMLDYTKRTTDDLALLSGKNIYALRFGSVNGWSPNLRTDLAINAMYTSAKKSGKIKVSNPQVSRPVLGIKDLVRGVKTIIESNRVSGIYNMASFNSTIEDLAQSVAECTGASIERLPNGSTFDMTMSSQKFETIYNFKFEETVETIIKSLDRKTELEGVRTECPML